jgi:hypothetical protein
MCHSMGTLTRYDSESRVLPNEVNFNESECVKCPMKEWFEMVEESGSAARVEHVLRLSRSYHLPARNVLAPKSIRSRR